MPEDLGFKYPYEQSLAARFAMNAAKKQRESRSDNTGADVDFNAIIKILDMDPYVLSDTHFFHKKAYTDYCPTRQTFAPTFEEFEQKLYRLLDTLPALLHLGDVCMNTKDPEKTRARFLAVSRRLYSIPKILVRGNHDALPDEFFRENGWQIISGVVNVPDRTEQPGPPCLLFETRSGLVMASHYPATSAPQYSPDDRRISTELFTMAQEAAVNHTLHGHTHETSYPRHNMTNVSIEALTFEPKRLSALVGPMLALSVLGARPCENTRGTLKGR